MQTSKNITPSESILYSGSFYWNKEDGSKQKIDVPGTYEIMPGQTMVITTTLPKDYDKTAFAIRSSLQDVKFYVGNKLRAQYSTKDTRMAGKNSASRYVFCPTSYKDKEGNQCWKAVLVIYGLPNLDLISTIYLIHNACIIRGIGR